MSGISVVILTRNEELNIADCLDSVAWSDDVHVFDSESTDRTATIARSRGAHVATRRFDSYAGQRNAALTTLHFKHEWVFVLDADERASGSLHTEMEAAILSASPSVSAFRIRRLDYFLGRQLKHAQMAAWYVRLLRRGHARYTRAVNEVLEVDG
jgi:glycosyltransferase involved in cell wall biosynthesis